MKWLQHLKTITQHKIKVTWLCFRCHLFKQGLLHDLSKYSYIELKTGFKYYQGYRSPIDAEKEEKGYSLGWLHHKGRNKHHFEYWIDYSLEHDHHMCGMRMPKKYVAEMLADRIAASKVYNKGHYNHHQPLEYFLRGKNNYMMHPQTLKELEHMLRILDKYGEEKCFRYVKNIYLKK